MSPNNLIIYLIIIYSHNYLKLHIRYYNSYYVHILQYYWLLIKCIKDKNEGMKDIGIQQIIDINGIHWHG